MVSLRRTRTGCSGTCSRSPATGPQPRTCSRETWLRVLERGYQYRAQWKFDVWLFSIARHLVIDLARKKKGSSLDELMAPEAGAGFEPPAQNRSAGWGGSLRSPTPCG